VGYFCRFLKVAQRKQSPILLVTLNKGLADGIFSYQKSQFWYILENLGMENFGTFKAVWNIYGQLVYFAYNHLVYIFHPVLVCCTETNLATMPKPENIFCSVDKQKFMCCMLAEVGRDVFLLNENLGLEVGPSLKGPVLGPLHFLRTKILYSRSPNT
jgi:hypothetical protein